MPEPIQQLLTAYFASDDHGRVEWRAADGDHDYALWLASTSGELTACIAASIGQLLANAAAAAGDRGATDAEEITAITEAMMRLLAGVPLRSDGKLTIKSLAAEADLRRNKLTHKHTGLKDLFNALIKAQDARPAVAENLHNDNVELRAKLATLAQERDELKAGNEQFARVVHVLEVENQQLRAALKGPDNVRLLHRPPN